MTSSLQIENLRMVAPGSGRYALANASSFIREAVDLSGASKPNVLTITTAEPTRAHYREFIRQSQHQFEKKIGANVVNLHGFGKAPSKQEIAHKIGQADVIWVAGGDTVHMLEFWKRHRIDAELLAAANAGTVMGGGSAGMLAWMRQGHSDYRSYRVAKNEPWDYEFVPGLGFLALTGCPHWDSKKDGTLRGDDFIEKYAAAPNDVPDVGLGIANMAALALNGDGMFRVLTSPDQKFPNAGVHIVTRTENGAIHDERLPVELEYRPLSF